MKHTTNIIFGAVTLFCFGMIIHSQLQIDSLNNKITDLSVQINSYSNQIVELTTTADVHRVYVKVHNMHPGIKSNLAIVIAKTVVEQAKILNENPDVYLSLIKIESDFNPKARSYTNAQGLMQVMPFWKSTICAGSNLFDPVDNIKCGTRIFAMYKQQTGGNIESTMTMYNAGPIVLRAGIRHSIVSDYSRSVMGEFNKLASYISSKVE